MQTWELDWIWRLAMDEIALSDRDRLVPCAGFLVISIAL